MKNKPVRVIMDLILLVLIILLYHTILSAFWAEGQWPWVGAIGLLAIISITSMILINIQNFYD